MNLTVAMKIIGGFTIISILLLLTSAISLLNLNTISDSTSQQNELAIPMLKGSNTLSLQLSQMENFTLKGFYEYDLTALAENLNSYQTFNAQFSDAFKQLKILAQNENELIKNLNKVTPIFTKYNGAAIEIFESRKVSIEQKLILGAKVRSLEEKTDDIVTLLLGLADHDLASHLRRSIRLSKKLESKLKTIASYSTEYSDTLSKDKSLLIKSEMLLGLEGTQSYINVVIADLKKNGINDVAQQLFELFANIEELLSTDSGIIHYKNTQLSANKTAKGLLKLVEENTRLATDILDKQVNLTNQTTIKTSELVKKSVASGNSQTIIIASISIVIAIVIARFTLISITRPLARVNNILNIVSSGDLSRKLDEAGNDEFSQLSKNCNLLIDSLRNLIESIVNRSSQLAAAAEQTSAVTAESTTAIEEQRSQVEQAATATTEMSSTAQSVLSSVNDALGEIKQADDEAERVKVISARNRQTIEQLATEVDTAAQVINQFVVLQSKPTYSL